MSERLAVLGLASGTLFLLAALLATDTVARVMFGVAAVLWLASSASGFWSQRRGVPPVRQSGSFWTTTRWTRRQALIATGCFAAIGVAGLLLWVPLAVGGFTGAAATGMGVVLGNTLA